jgi:hypothetical protein
MTKKKTSFTTDKIFGGLRRWGNAGLGKGGMGKYENKKGEKVRR